MDARGNVTKRSKSPLITPPKGKDDDTDIAFAASAVLVGKEIWLYYSIADKAANRAIITLEE